LYTTIFVKGYNLTEGITVSVHEGYPDFAITRYNNDDYSDELNISLNDSLIGLYIYVKFAPTTSGAKAGTIRLSSEGAADYDISLAGEGIE
jgi:hypothetical protein